MSCNYKLKITTINFTTKDWSELVFWVHGWIRTDPKEPGCSHCPPTSGLVVDQLWSTVAPLGGKKLNQIGL